MTKTMIYNNTEYSDKEIFNFLAGYRYWLEKEIFAYKFDGNGYDTISIYPKELNRRDTELLTSMHGTNPVRI